MDEEPVGGGGNAAIVAPPARVAEAPAVAPPAMRPGARARAVGGWARVCPTRRIFQTYVWVNFPIFSAFFRFFPLSGLAVLLQE